MRATKLMRGASAAALLLSLWPTCVLAQTSLPTIDVGAARRVVSKNKGRETTHPVRGARGGGKARVARAGTGTEAGGGAGGGGGEGAGAAGGAGTGAGGYGGAGPAQDPYNKSYVLQNASTGTKTNTPVMETPLNVQSVSQQVLNDQQATTLAQALQNFSGVSVAPGLSTNFTGFASSGIYVRGFLSSTYYRDGFRVDSSLSGWDAVGDRQLANIASVEVLKGPGAILYGLVEPGGIVNIVTKEPLNAPYYAVEQQVGSLAFYRTTIDSTGPLDKDGSLLYRMNLSYENNGAPFGEFEDRTHSQSIFMAPVLKWNIDAATWVKLEAEYNDYRNNLFIPFDPVLNGIFLNIPRNTNYNDSPSYRQSSLFSALTWSHEFDKDWSIKQQVAFNRVLSNPTNVLAQSAFNNYPPFPFPVVGQYVQYVPFWQQVYSTNVDLKGHINTFGAEHTLLLGGDIYRTTFAFPTDFLSGTPLVSLINPVEPGVPPATCPCFPFASYDTQNTAGLYLQDQVKLPYNFFVLAGARYQYIRQTSESGSALDDLNNFGPPIPPLTAQALTPRFGLLWRPQEWLSLYGNYTEGFGPNNQGLIFPGVIPAPTSARSWEAGAKLELFDGKLRASADYFELVKTNVPFGDPAHPGYVLLVGEARSTGPELDVQGEILPGWNVIATYTNDDVRVTKGAQGQNGSGEGGAGGPVGSRFPFVPRNKASLWTTYEFQDAAWKGLKIGAGYIYSGSTPVFDTAANSGLNPPGVFRDIPGAGVANLMAAYSFNYAGSKMTAQINVNNLLDRTYYTAASNTGMVVPGFTGSASYRQYGAPFSVLGSLRAELDKGATPPAFLVPSPSPMSPAFTWTGFYVGGHIGYGWGDNYGAVSIASAGGYNGQTSSDGDAQGTIGGFHLGYNQQFDRWVIGLEGSVDATTLNKSLMLVYPDPPSVDSAGSIVTGTVKSGIQGSVRARAGVSVFDRMLIYGTGGVAFAPFNTDLQLTGMDGVGLFAASGNASATKTGWTAGGGVEWAINSRWSLRGEYRHSDFGNLAIYPGLSSIGAVFAVDRHLAQDQVQVGFSYNFSGSEPEIAQAPKIVRGPALAENGASKPASAKPAVPPPPSPPFVVDWTGFYLGGQIGYGWGLNDGSIAYATPGGLAGQSNLNGNAILIGGSKSYVNGDAIGVIGGVHLGYNKQFGKWVVGLEGGADLPGLSRRVSILVPDLAADPTGTLGIGATATGAIWSEIQGSIRARAGFALDRLLLYGAGGVAIGEFGSNFQLGGVDTPPTLAPFYAGDMRSALRVGWTVGAGVEYAINPHWTVRGEYRYTDFGHLGDSPAATSMGVVYTADRHLDQQQVQVGVSYHFNDGAAPVETKAIAAGLPSIKAPAILPPLPTSWTGFHGGVNLGGGWSINNNNSTNFLPFTDPAFPFGASEPVGGGGFLPNLLFLPGDNGYTNKTDGIVGGAQVGYDFQIGKSIVIGAEADIQGTTIASGHNGAYLNVLGSPFVGGSLLLPLGGGAPVGNVGVPWFGTVRGRAGGLLNPTLLLYGTGGFAYGGLDVAGYSTSAAGWTVGAGGEWMFAPNWSAKLEYLYMNPTSSGANGASGGFSTGGSNRSSPAINVVRTGVNYHFNWADPAPVLAKY